MAVSMMQYTVPTTPATQLGIIPPGGTMILTCIETSADVYLGTSSTVTSSTGAPLVPNITTTISLPDTSGPVTVWGIAGTGSHVVGVIIITTA